AIKHVSIARGHDVTRAALVAFGGAGGQHACKVAEALGIETVLIHPLAGVLSAFGIGLADLMSIAERPVERPLDSATAERLAHLFGELAVAAEHALAASPVAPARVRLSKRVAIRVEGSDTALAVPFAGADAMRAAFEALHRKTFGFAPASRALIVDSVRLEAAGEMPVPHLAP